jgi:DNA-directed RNA polymerase specialized sigma24 family protein
MDDRESQARLDNLGDRCREVVRLAGEGVTSRQIAKELRIPSGEVEDCLRDLFGFGRGDDVGAPA